MTPSRKPLALFLTILLALSTVALSSSTNAEETSARVTNNEEIVVSVNYIYYDRGGDITFTVMSSNLDPGTEYTIDWVLCDWNGYDCEYDYSGLSGTSGSEDLGSGNMFTVSTITFTDPGLPTEYLDSNGDWVYDGFGNNSLVFKAELNVQGVPLDTNLSEPFVMGGEVRDSSSYTYMNTVSNILKTMDVVFDGRISMDHANEYVLEYTLTCELFESGAATPADSVSRIVNTSSYRQDFNSQYSFYDNVSNTYEALTPTANSGGHYVQCTYTRNVDNAVVGSVTSNVFQVIDADITGNEEISSQSMSSTYFPRTDGTTPSTITLVLDAENLYDGTEYTIGWEICDWNGYDCEYGYSGLTGTSGSVSFTATSSGTHTETITFTDPGLPTEYLDSNGDWVYDGFGNNSLVFKAELNVQGVPLDTNLSEPFVMGGEVRDSSSYTYMNTVSNILKTMDVVFDGRISMDHANEYVLEYTLTCELFESGAATPADSVSRIVNTSSYRQDFNSQYSFYDNVSNTYEALTPTANSGGHYVQCTYTRNVDNAVVGSVTSNVFQVIDADITGNEEISSQSMSSTYFPRTDGTTPSTITLVLDAENLYDGTEYTIGWEICDWNGYDCEYGYSGLTGTSGSVSFTATSSGTHTETITFTDPGLPTEYLDSNGDWVYDGFGNNSLVFKAELNVQGVPLDTNLSEPFVMGGEVRDSSSYTYMNTVSNILKTMDVVFDGRISMDHANEYVLEYTLTCELFESGAATPADSVSRIVNTSSYRQDFNSQYSFYDNVSNTYEALTPTANSGGHYVQCTYTRNVDNAVVGSVTSNVFQVIDDTSNQDDATIVVGSTMNLQEAWGTVTIDAIELDAGQEYTLDWVVEDYSLSPPTVMMQNDHIWVAGNDGTYTYELEFHDLADTTDACITVVFTAGDDELQVVDNVCWMSASTADGDGDGVYDKNDLCPDTSAGLAVTADGCSDSDNDGFDTDLEIDCNTDPNDALSFPTDLDNDGTCDYLDTDTDGDGYLDVDELAAGTDPFDPLSKPANRLPECAVYYNLEIDGIPTSFDGEAAIPALSGVTATTAAASLTPTTVTIPAGSYYITAHCIDPDGDDVTVTVNEITVGPVAGEVSGAVLIEIGEDVDETMDVQITWSDGTDSLTALVTVELDGGSLGLIPGFGTALTIMALLGAGFVLARKDD